MLALIASPAAAESPVIRLSRQTGELTCTNLPPGTTATIQWAATPVGPWTDAWTDLREAEVDSNGMLRIGVPAFFRAVAHIHPENLAPVADAGPDLTADPGTAVLLDASASTDEDGAIVSYQWAQLAGPPVTLSDTSSVQLTFTAPAALAADRTLVFRLTTTDEAGAQSSDTCEVRLNDIWPGSAWETATPAEMGMDETLLQQARSFALAGGGSGMVIRGGKLVMSWGNSTDTYDVKSTTKSIGLAALGLAIGDGLLELNSLAQNHHPGFGVPPSGNANTGWLDDITLLHLATHTAGFDKDGGYTALLFAPGTEWSYSDGGPNWLAECITLAYGQDLNTLMFDRIFSVIGIPPDELTWRDNQNRPDTIQGIKNREFGAGISCSVNAMARIGYLFLRDGKWNGVQILPESVVRAARTNVSEFVGIPVRDPAEFYDASSHHGLLWWNNWDGTLENVPRDACWSWGLSESLIVVIPSLDVVAARAGSGWQSGWSADYEVLRGFLEPLAASVEAAVGPAPSTALSPVNGELVHSNLPPGSTVTIELAPDESGPWMDTWAAFRKLPAATNGAVSVTVPTRYRIRPNSPP